MTRVRDIMTSAVVTVGPGLTIREAAELLASRHISGAPVVDHGRVVGLITATDILDFVAALPGVPPELVDDTEWNSLEEHTVDEAMTNAPLHTLPPDATARQAAEMMQKEDIHRIVVMEGERLVGVVSTLDITRALASQPPPSARTYVFGHPGSSDVRR
jgi:CBS domain-containing protein